MTVTAASSRVVYPGTGSPGPFAVAKNGEPIVFKDADHIHVARRSAAGIETDLVRDNHYTLTGGPTNGEVLLTTGLAPGETLAIWRAQPLAETSNFELVGDFASTTHNQVNDRHRYIDQELDDKISRALKLSRFASNEARVEVTPSPNTLLGFNADRELVVIDVDELSDFADGDSLGVTPVAKGGTGATTSVGARKTLGINFVVVNATTNVKPGSVVDGDHYIVPLTATGDWAGHVGKIAYAESDTFSYLTPQEGWTAFAKNTDILYYFDGGSWVAASGSGTSGGGSGGSADFADLDGRVIGIGQVNGHGGQEFTVRHTADGRILVTGDQAALGYDPAGDNWIPFEVEWDRSITIEKIYVGSDYLIIQTDQETGNLWSMGKNTTYGVLGHGDTSNRIIPERIQWLVNNDVHVDQVVTETNTGHAHRFWFGITAEHKLIGCGAGDNYTQGNSATTAVTTPAYIKDNAANDIADIVEVSCSSIHGPVWARTSAGTAYRWGAGTSGAHANSGTMALQFPQMLGGGSPQTGISKIVTTSSSHSNTRAVTAAIIGGLLRVCGSQAYGIGTGVTSGNQLTFAVPTGAIGGETIDDIAIGGGEYAVLAAIDSHGEMWFAGRNAHGLAANGSTSDVATFIKPVMPDGVQGAIEKVKIGGFNNFGAIFLQCSIGNVRTLYATGYDATYQTGKGIAGSSAFGRTYGKILGQTFGIADWQIVGDEEYYGLHVRCDNGTDRYCGANAQGQGGTQPGNLHAVPYLQPVQGLGARLLKQIRWIDAGWALSQEYEALDALNHDGAAYICTNTHTSGSETRPGAGASWATVWSLLASKGDPGPGYAAASSTSLTIGTGSKVSTTQSDLAYQVGSRVRFSAALNPVNAWMEGVVSAYSGTTLTVTMDHTRGSGAFSLWFISVAGETGDVTPAAVAAKVAAEAATVLAAESASSASGHATNAETSKNAAEASATAAAGSATAAAGTVSVISGHAADALASKNAAAASATTASGHAGDALASKNAAASSATAASGNATAAGNSVTAASGHATNAEASKNAAVSSATAAAGSATAAGSSATAAAGSATTAGNSATAASGHATNAETSKNAAASSATAAAGSATAAGNSATAASGHAGDALASKNAAASSASAASGHAADANSSKIAAGNSFLLISGIASSADTARNAAVAAYVDLTKRYPGSFGTDPTVDGGGNPLANGAMYFNTALSRLRVFNGGWQDLPEAVHSIGHFAFTATAAQTVFTGLDDSGNTLLYTPSLCVVTRNGAILVKDEDYTAINGSTVTLAVGAASGDVIAVLAFSSVVLADTYSQAAVDSLLANKLSAALATDADVRSAAAGSKAITAAHIETSSAPVALTDASTIAVNWDAFINGTLTIAANRSIGNPTNGQPGTWRTILVQGSSATDRTITFGNQFGGNLPTLTDCNNTKKYHLSIYCKTPSQFLVVAMNGSDA